MKHTLKRLLTLGLLSASLAFTPRATAATLNAGDIVLVGHNSDTAPESFTFMPLVDIPGGTVVKITDNQWNDATATPPSAFGTSIISEAKITWTPTATVPAGTLFQISRASAATSITFLNITTGVSITVTNTNSGGPSTGELFYSGWTGPTTVLNANGDGIFFYQDADANPFFLSGFLNSSIASGFNPTTRWHNTATNAQVSSSVVPVAGVGNQNGINIGTAPHNDGEAGTNGLSLSDTTSIFFNVQYTGPTSATNRAGWLSRVMTATNWSGTNGASPPANSIGTTLGSLAVISNFTTVTSLNRVNPATTNLSTVNWTLTFAAANTGVTASNFSLSGAAATGASVGTPTTSNGGLTWNVPVTTGSTDGTLTLSLANATGTTPGVSTTLPFAGQSYTMDKTLPTVSIGAPSASSVAPGGSVSYTVTYADTNFASSSLTTGGITLNTTGGASGTIGLSGSGTSYTVTISSITGAGTIGINVAAGTSLDTAGNANLVSAASTTFNVVSNNADLSALTTTAIGMTPAFGAATTAYNATVPNGTTTTTVTATRAEANATLAVQVNGGGFTTLTSGVASGNLSLNVGANPIDVRVTAQDGTTIKTYTITATRAAAVTGTPNLIVHDGATTAAALLTPGSVWTATTTTGAPVPRDEMTSVWTGATGNAATANRMIVWGGNDGTTIKNTGGIYNPTTNSWSATTTTSAPAARLRHVAVWTGATGNASTAQRMIVYGGDGGAATLNSGGIYNPATDAWSATTSTGAPPTSADGCGVWTGATGNAATANRLIVWGGWSSVGGGSGVGTGGIYDPATNTWSTVTTTGAPTARAWPRAVWTGNTGNAATANRMIVFGGESPYGVATVNDGGIYDPATNTWTAIPANATAGDHAAHTAVWTGSEMIVFGGYGDAFTAVTSGARFNPATGVWTALPTSGQPAARQFHTGHWTGDSMILFGGYGTGFTQLNSGGLYSPTTNAWTATSTSGAPAGRAAHAGVWTGSQLIVFGGNGSAGVVNTGGVLDTTPTIALGSQAVGSPLARSFNIENTGTGDLTGVSVSFGGTNAADFAVGSAPSGTIAAAGNSAFSINFTPGGAGARTATMTITSNDPIRQPYSVILTGSGTAAASNNADLSALTTTATGLTPAFGANTLAYTATVLNATTTTTVTATRAEANATLQVQVNGLGFNPLTSGTPSSALALNVGANPIDVKVTAQDGTTIKTYTITVTRAAPAAEIPLTLASGSLNIDAGSSPGAANTILRFVTGPGGPFLEIFDAGRTLGAPVGGTQVNSNTVRIPIASLTGGITLTGSALADTFTLNFTDGDICPPGGIHVIGGAPTISPGDTLVIDGDFTSGGSYGTGSPGAGTLGLDSGNTVTFTGLEPVDMSAASFVDFTITVDPTAVFSGNVITTVAAVNAGVNTDVTFGSSGLESCKLGVVTGTLTINGDNVEQDYFILQGLGSAMAGHFVVDGRGGDSDVIEVNNTTFTVAGLNKNLSLKADFIGLGRVNAVSPSDNPGVIVCSGNITLEADGDSSLSANTLWGTTNVWGASTPAYFNAGQVPYTARGTIQIMGDIKKTAGADALLTLKAKNAIVMPNTAATATSPAGSIVSTSNKLNVLMNADSDAVNAGNVVMLERSVLTTNGGDWTVGGGSTPLLTPVTGIVSSNNTAPGVFLRSSTITTGGGNVSIRSQGAAASGGFGLIMNVSASTVGCVLNSGAGNVTVNATGGANNAAHGISFIGNNTGTLTSRILSSSGNIDLSGTATHAFASGVNLGTLSEVASTSGAASITAAAVTGGSIAFLVAPASPGTATVSAGTTVTLAADTMNLNANGSGARSFTAGSGSGTITLKPRTAGAIMDLGGVDDVGLPQLGILDAELDLLNAATVNIGDSASGAITVSAIISPASYKTLALAKNTTFSATGGFTSDVTSASVFEKITVTGTVNITAGAALTMASTGGYIWNGTDAFTLLDNDLADVITGTFTGPTLTNFLGSALTAQAFYNTSGGNDLILGAALSSNADLSALVINTATYSPAFAAGTTTGYTASVSNSTSSVTVTPTRAQANATIEARSNANAFASVTSGSPSGALALNLGSNTLDVKVTAQDGITLKTYTITVTRRSIIEDWRLGFFADASGTANRANGSDFDLDGKTNLLEFAFGTDPTLGSSGPPDLTMTGTYAAAVFGTTGQPVTRLEPVTNGVDFRAVFIRRVDHAAAGLTYTPEFSADMGTWTPSAIIPTVLATSGSFQLVSVPYPHFLSNGKKARFFKVTVSIAP